MTIEYGHSHFAALLLLFIPLGWWFAYEQKGSFFRYPWIVLVLFYSLLVFTFGRFSLLLALLQLPAIYYFTAGRALKKRRNIFLLLGLVFFCLTAFVVGLSFLDDCAVSEFKLQLCKPLSREVRPEYFKQALGAFLDNPSTGYGPGTFELITRRYTTVPAYSSVFAHNVFLQIAGESGIFAFIFFTAFVFASIRKLFLQVFKKNARHRFLPGMILIGFVTLFFNSLVDFDWNMFPTFSISMLLLAVGLWQRKTSSGKVNSENKKIYLLWLVISSLVVSYGLLVGVTKYLIISGKPMAAFDLFPYVHKLSKTFFDADKNSQQRNKLYDVYEFHSDALLKQIQSEENANTKIQLYKKLIRVNPWMVTDESYLKLLVQEDMYSELGSSAYTALMLIDVVHSETRIDFTNRRSQLLKYLHMSALKEIETGNLELATQYYSVILNHFYLISDDDWYILYNQYIADQDYSWGEAISTYFKLLANEDRALATSEILSVLHMVEVSQQSSERDEIFAGTQLAVITNLIANDYLQSGDSLRAAELYVAAQKLDSHIFSIVMPGFINHTIPNDQEDAFWDALYSIAGESYANYSDVVASEYRRRFLSAVQRGDIDLARKYYTKYREIDFRDTQPLALSEIVELQQLANKFIKSGESNSAEKALELLFNTNSYESKIQLGNYYVFIEKDDLAMAHFEECLSEWQSQYGMVHKGCEISIQNLRSENIDRNSYWHTSEYLIHSL